MFTVKLHKILLTQLIVINFRWWTGSRMVSCCGLSSINEGLWGGIFCCFALIWKYFLRFSFFFVFLCCARLFHICQFQKYMHRSNRHLCGIVLKFVSRAFKMEWLPSDINLKLAWRNGIKFMHTIDNKFADLWHYIKMWICNIMLIEWIVFPGPGIANQWIEIEHCRFAQIPCWGGQTTRQST